MLEIWQRQALARPLQRSRTRTHGLGHWKQYVDPPTRCGEVSGRDLAGRTSLEV